MQIRAVKGYSTLNSALLCTYLYVNVSFMQTSTKASSTDVVLKANTVLLFYIKRVIVHQHGNLSQQRLRSQ